MIGKRMSGWRLGKAAKTPLSYERVKPGAALPAAFLRSMRLVRWIVPALWLAAAVNLRASAASDRIAAAQTWLQEEQVYYGEITGRMDEETAAAIRRFQMLHELRVTGRLDGRTSLAMGLEPEPPPRRWTESDKLFLKSLTRSQQRPEPVGAKEKPEASATPSSTPLPSASAQPKSASKKTAPSTPQEEGGAPKKKRKRQREKK